ncbi:hypothetical protein GOV06_02415 [Candidatus Woesearchaeota archaeon]|nr:hypothetical protein [Candidatus Woesearchaeota archaeon]
MIKKILYAKALFMTLLILTLPVYISKVYAADELTVTKYSGDAGVDGYLDSRDRWLLEATAQIDGDDTITPEQVQINGFSFTSCSPGAPGQFTCTYTGSYYTFPPGEYPAVFTLVDDNGQTVETDDQKTMTIDNLAPIIDIVNAQQIGQELKVTYTIKDMAYQQNDFSKCSGIKKIEFWDSGIFMDSDDEDTSECSYSGEITLPLPSSDRLILKAHDQIGHITTRQKEIVSIVDNDAPVIITESFKLWNGDMLLEEYITGQPFAANAEIRVRDESIAASGAGVKADFSGLGAGSDVEATSCLRSGIDYLCRWTGIMISITSSQTVNIVFNIEDTFGNSASALASTTFVVDTTPPVVTYMGTEESYEGIGYIGDVASDIVVKLTETGSGISPDNIFLDLSDVNPAYGSTVPADGCEESGNEYICRWIGKITTRSHGSSAGVYLISARDNTGNLASGISSAVIKIDKNSPLANLPEIRAFGELATPSGLVASNDEVIITVGGTDDSGVRAFGDFSRVYGQSGADNLEAVCQKTGDDFICVWDLDSVVSGFLNTTIALDFIDTAENSRTIEFPFVIYEKDFESAPDYWTVDDISISPSKIDKETAPIINQRVYAKIELDSAQGAETAEIKLGGCTGDTGYADAISIFNNQRSSKEPYIIFDLKKIDAANLGNITINCTLEIMSVYNRGLSNVELEPVVVTIPFADNPLGEASDKIEDKIDDLKETYVDGWFEKITQLRKLWNIAEMICQLLKTLQDIKVILSLAVKKLGAAEIAAPPTPVPAKEALWTVRLKYCVQSEYVRDNSDRTYVTLNKFCKFINCRPAEDVGGPWQNWVGSYQTAGNAILNACGGGVATRYFGKFGKEPDDYLNPKDNMIIAVLTACIPGILNGLERYRQIQCGYIVCLQDSLYSGVPESACDNLKHYQTCKYWVGEVLNACPITAVFFNFMDTIKNMVSDPFSVIGAVLSATCLIHCTTHPGEGGVMYNICVGIKILSMVGEIGTDVATIIDKDAWSMENEIDYCELVD